MLPVTDIVVFANKGDNQTNGLVYLCTYNHKHWRLLPMGKREGDKEGQISLLGVDTTEKDLLIIEKSKDYEKVPETLQIWDNTAGNFRNFAFTTDSISEKSCCSYGVPRNALLKATISADSKYGGERVFFVENNEIRLY